MRVWLYMCYKKNAGVLVGDVHERPRFNYNS